MASAEQETQEQKMDIHMQRDKEVLKPLSIDEFRKFENVKRTLIDGHFVYPTGVVQLEDDTYLIAVRHIIDQLEKPAFMMHVDHKYAVPSFFGDYYSTTTTYGCKQYIYSPILENINSSTLQELVYSAIEQHIIMKNTTPKIESKYCK